MTEEKKNTIGETRKRLHKLTAHLEEMYRRCREDVNGEEETEEEG